MGLKQRGDYRGRATDSGKRGGAQSIPAVARPQAQPQMNRAPEAPTLQRAFEAATRRDCAVTAPAPPQQLHPASCCRDVVLDPPEFPRTLERRLLVFHNFSRDHIWVGQVVRIVKALIP